MLAGNATKPPQRVLQSLCQCHIALAPKHHMRMLEAGERQPEVVEPMRQHGPCDLNAKFTRIGSPAFFATLTTLAQQADAARRHH